MRPSTRLGILLPAVVGGLLAGAAQAADLTVSGFRLRITNPVAGVQSNRVLFISHDPNVFVPPGGDTDDPTIYGGRLEVAGPGGEAFTIILPPAGWAAVGEGQFRYKDLTGATCMKAFVRTTGLTRVKATCRGPQVDYDLPVGIGNVAVALITGSPGRRYCGDFGGTQLATAPNVVFERNNAPAPGMCPLP